MKLSFNEVLVPLDGSPSAERAVGIAREIATRTGSTLILMSCSTPDAVEARGHYLQGLARADAERADRTLVFDDESATRAIIASCGPETLVCMSTHGHGRSAALLGSVAESVLRERKVPVVLVGPRVPTHAFLGAGRIVACLDGATDATAALERSAELAIALGMPLWLTEVLTPDSTPDAAGTDVLETSTLAMAARQLGDVVEGWDVLHDTKPARALSRHAASAPVSMLVLTTHGATGWRRVALGSVTAEVVHEAHVPVLVVPAALAAPGTQPPRAERVTTNG